MQKIEDLALALKNGEWDEDSERIFNSLLKDEVDIARMMHVAGEYTPYVRVSKPIYERILELNPEDVNVIVQLGWVLWLDGENEASREQLESAKEIAAEDVEVLTLDAALTKDPSAKVVLYKKILGKDPTNMIAQKNLEQLESSSNS